MRRSFFWWIHIWEILILQISGEVSSDQDPDLSNSPSKYHNVHLIFRKDLALSLPPYRPYDCTIDLLTRAPVPFGRFFSLSMKDRESMEKYIHDSLEAGIICPLSFFLVLVSSLFLKKMVHYTPVYITLTSIRLQLGTNIKFPCFHQPSNQSKASIFSELDLKNTYHLVRIQAEDEWKTAFKLISNAPVVFQNLVNEVLRDFLHKFVFVYLDDILIFPETLEEHKQHIRLVLQGLIENRL